MVNKKKWPKVWTGKGCPRGPYKLQYKGEYKCPFCRYKHKENLICNGVNVFTKYLVKKLNWPSALSEEKWIKEEPLITEY